MQETLKNLNKPLKCLIVPGAEVSHGPVHTSEERVWLFWWITTQTLFKFNNSVAKLLQPSFSS